VWVEILLDQDFSSRPPERWLASWRRLGLDWAAGTGTDGWLRLEVLLRPIYQALQQRHRLGDWPPGDEARWRLFLVPEGQEGSGWWWWVVLGPDTVVDLLDASRGHTVPANPSGAQSRGVWVVDRSAASKALSWVKDGVIVLAVCGSQVRRDFLRVGQGWPELKTWALEGLRRIRVRSRLNDQRWAVERGSAAFGEADGRRRQAGDAFQTQRETELAQVGLATPCRKALESRHEPWEGRTRFGDDPRIPRDNTASERRARGPAVAGKNFSGSGAEWSGPRAATRLSILARVSLWQLNPRRGLTGDFERCAAAGGQVPEEIPRFVPWTLSPEKKNELSATGGSQGEDVSRSRAPPGQASECSDKSDGGEAGLGTETRGSSSTAH
jgi:hypothetical protein